MEVFPDTDEPADRQDESVRQFASADGGCSHDRRSGSLGGRVPETASEQDDASGTALLFPAKLEIRAARHDNR